MTITDTPILRHAAGASSSTWLVREAEDGDGHTIEGIAVPYDTPTPVVDWEGRYTETFVRGSFRKTIRERGDKVKILFQHRSHALPIGRAVHLEERDEGLFMRARIIDTEEGELVLKHIRFGTLDSFSIGFHPVRDEWNGEKTEVIRKEVALREVSVVTFPAYPDATITDVRQVGAVAANGLTPGGYFPGMGVPWAPGTYAPSSTHYDLTQTPITVATQPGTYRIASDGTADGTPATESDLESTPAVSTNDPDHRARVASLRDW